MTFAGVRHAADNGNGYFLHAYLAIDAVHRADEACGVAAGQL